VTDIYDFGSKYAQVYKQKCKCGEEIEVSAQKDEYFHCPEYYTEIYVKCSCGESVKFVIPVN